MIYGLVSVGSLRTGNTRTIREGNERVAAQVGEHVALYMQNNVRVLRSVGSDLGASRLERWQQDRIVKNYVLDFPEFREISLFDPDGQLVVTSRTGKATVSVPKQVVSAEGVDIAAFKVDDDLLPTTTISVRLGRAGEEMGWIVGELSLEELWRMVDRVRVGSRGYALIVGEDGRLIAHGNPEEKRHIATNESNAGAAKS